MAGTQVFVTLACEYILIILKKKAFQVYITFLLHKHEQVKTSVCFFSVFFIFWDRWTFFEPWTYLPTKYDLNTWN